MSKAVKVVKNVFSAVPIVGKPVSNLVLGKEKAAADAARAASVSQQGAKRAAVARDRQDAIESAATAAGAVRSDNEADILGRSIYATKRRGAAKTLLG